MFFYNDTHEAQFLALLALNKKGGQPNERRSSLYVAACLPDWALAPLKGQDYLTFTELLTWTNEDHPQHARLSQTDTQLIRLAYTLFHGEDAELNVPLQDYLGYQYEYKEVVVHALQQQYGLSSV